MQDLVLAVVAETDTIKLNGAYDIAQHRRTLWILIFRPLAHDLLRALESGQSFGDLGSDIDDLHDRSNQEAQQEGVGEEAADGESARKNLVGADVHGDCADASEQNAGGETHHRRGGQGAHDVIEQAPHAGSKDRLLAFLGVIPLDHPYAAERLCEPACDFGVDLAALTEDRADRGKCLVQRNRKAQQRADGDQCHQRASSE